MWRSVPSVRVRNNKAILVSVLMLMSLVTFAASPVGAAGDEPTVSCGYPNVTAGVMELIVYSNDADALSGAIVERSRDGSQWWWRGRVELAVEQFTDLLPDGSVIEYRVRGVLSAGGYTEPALCGVVDLDGEIAPPESCAVKVDRFGNVEVVTKQNDHLYRSFVVSRSVDAGARYWRGITPAWVFDGYFQDTMRPGTTAQYDVVAVSANGTRSTPTRCGDPVTFDFAPPVILSCSNWGFTALHLQVRTDGAIAVAFYRSTDGGPAYWRGRYDPAIAPSWDDPTVVPGKKYDYYAEAIGPTGLRSERHFCASLELNPIFAWN